MSIRPFLLVAVAVATLAGACTSDRVAAPPDAVAEGASAQPSLVEDEPRSGGGSRKAGSRGEKKRSDKNSGGDPGGSNGPTGGNEPGGNEPRSGPARGSAVVTDPPADGDTSGETPDYADILRASMSGRGKMVQIRTLVVASLPDRMPDDDTFMGIETRIERKKGRYSIIVEGDHNGWRASISRNGKSRSLSGLAIEDDSVTIAIPWSAIGGAGRLKWETHAGWTRATLTQTHYAFDSAPSYGAARYPG